MSGRRLQIEWQEDAERLKRLYKEEREPELRVRWHALWLLRCGYSVAKVVEVVGVHERSVRRWIAWYRKGGIEEIRRHRRGGRQGQPPKLTPAQQEALKARAAEGAFRTIYDAVEWVRETFGVEYTYWGMRSWFEREQIKRKVPRPQAVKADPAEQEGWKKGGSPPPSEQMA